MNVRAQSLKKHAEWRGKVETRVRVPVDDRESLSLAYTPGVAEPCMAIHEDSDKSFLLTRRWNTVPVITDGTAVLGLGDIGAEAGMPVMEGKCALFKAFGGVDAYPVCLNTKDTEEIIKTIKIISPSFGGINLEDISAPRCFEIEKRLKAELDIPVFHDDQHGTAIVVAAALINALKLAKKSAGEIKLVINGAGAAGISVAKFLLKLGVKDITVCDKGGIICVGEKWLNAPQREIAEVTNLSRKRGNLADAMKGADVFVGVSGPHCVTADMVRSMARGAILFTCANPVPEIECDEALSAGAFIVGTGSSEKPNQINNVLVFPGLFRGALDVRASTINDAMMLAAARAIAESVKENEMNKDYILPYAYDKRAHRAVANAVAQAARESGVAKLNKLAPDKKIFVVGDSTVCDFGEKHSDYYLPQFGYGTQLHNYLSLTDKNQVVNLALSGRSSLSFTREENYKTLKNSIGEGDFLIIGFGHNDEKSADKLRFTDPTADYKTPRTENGTSFQYTLYEHYIKLALDRGATPILCTPIARYNPEGVYDGLNFAHVTVDGDYPAAIRKLAADTDTALVDLTEITKNYYAANGDKAKYFHAFTTYEGKKPNEKPDGMDKTHINKYGAKQISYWLLTNMPLSCPLAAYVDVSCPPDFERDFYDAINKNFVKAEYGGFNPAKHAANKLPICGGEWFKTAMGDIGGQDKISGYAFDYKGGKLTLTSGQSSKFDAVQDGFGAAFVQIPESKNFTASAKAKVNGVKVPPNGKRAFGIMLRDDIYIDTHSQTIASSFVSASVNDEGKTCMSRTQRSNLDFGKKTLAIENGFEYSLTLTRVGQIIDVTVTCGDKICEKFTDVSLVGIDNNYLYLCLFASGGLTVEFSDIEFEITGNSQGA